MRELSQHLKERVKKNMGAQRVGFIAEDDDGVIIDYDDIGLGAMFTNVVKASLINLKPKDRIQYRAKAKEFLDAVVKELNARDKDESRSKKNAAKDK